MIQAIPNTPGDLLEIDISVFVVSMAYDFNADGVSITKAHRTTTGNDNVLTMTSYYFDLANGTWWKDVYPAVDRPYCLLTHFGTSAAERGVLFGCRDGYVRIVKDTNTTDNIGATEADIPSYVVYGPFMVGRGSYGKGLLAELTPVIATGTVKPTTAVVISAAFGNCAEAAATTSYTALGVVTKGRGATMRPHKGDVACCIKVASTASSPITATGVFDGVVFTTITANAPFFCSGMVGKEIVVTSTGSYGILFYVSSTVVMISGNFPFTDKTFSVDYGPWAIEELIAVLRDKGKKRLL